MIDVIVAMGVGVLIGAFGVIAWALSAVNKDRGEKDDRDQAGNAKIKLPLYALLNITVI